MEIAPPPGTEDFLVPAANPESEGFWAGTAVGELRVQVCGECGARRIPPRPMCPHCQSTRRGWEALSGRGTIWSFVVAHPPLLPAYARFAPYAVVTVTLEEDAALRMVGNLVTRPDGPINEVDPASIVIGEAVEAVFAPRHRPGAGTWYLPAWVRTRP